MPEEARRVIFAMAAAIAVFFAYMFLINRLWPPPPPPLPTATTQPAVRQPTPPAGMPAPGEQADATPTTGPLADARAPYELTVGHALEPILLGGGPEDALSVVIHPQGAAIDSIDLISRNPQGRYEYRLRADSNDPYELLRPQTLNGRTWRSFETDRVIIVERENQSWGLDHFVWQLADSGPGHADFTTALRPSEATEAAVATAQADLLRFRKSYTLKPGKPILQLALTIENPGAAPLTIRVAQNGPLGIPREDNQRDERLLVAARQDSSGNLSLGPVKHLSELHKGMARSEPVRLTPPDQGRFAWTALANKYFGVLTRPVDGDGQPAAFVAVAEGVLPTPFELATASDLLSRLWTAQQTIPPSSAVTYAFEIYAGPRDPELLAKANPAYVDPAGVNYALLLAANQMCCTCTFHPLPEWMAGLLHSIFYVVRNFGVAIFILVLIIRLLLHPLAVWQQRSMFFMQESMARIQPKMQEIREKYANDRTRMNQELMRLFGEERVNPAGNMVAFVPLFLQMPILVALWTSLSSDIRLRHAPFDGWWIRDLSAPDALIQFSTPIDIPVLSWLPLIGTMFSAIPSINLLPLLMGISMYLQQKYMPKPAMAARLQASKNQPPAERKPGQGPTPEEMMRQQQMIANMMCIMFPLLFYYMPSGLNLYWMSSNIFGICESLRIRKQIEAEKKRREALGPAALPDPKARKPGFVSRWLKQMAEQAEEIQKQADQLSERKRK